jgi:hypothetical protein
VFICASSYSQLCVHFLRSLCRYPSFLCSRLHAYTHSNTVYHTVHSTDTLNVAVEGGESNTDPSVHLTVGVDTHIWGLNFASLRDNCLKRSGMSDKVLLTKLEEPLYWDLQVIKTAFYFINPKPSSLLLLRYHSTSFKL